MRRYRIAFWILIYSIINFTLAAPVAVRDILGVRVNVVDVAKDRTAELQKRMDPVEDSDQSSDLTSEHGAPGPNSDPESDSDVDQSADSEMESDSNSDSDDSDGGEAAQQWEEEFGDYEPSEEEGDSEEEDSEEEGHEEDNSKEEDHEQSPPHSPESQHPAVSMYEDFWSTVLKGTLVPRTSTPGTVDAPKRKFQEIDNTRAYVSASILQTTRVATF